MTEAKGNFSAGLDLDSTYDKVEQNAYVDALNITRDSDIAGVGRGISNLVGNQQVVYTGMPAGNNICIGAFSNNSRNTLIYCLCNSNGKHSILEYSKPTGLITKIFENLTDSGGVDILFFTNSKKIRGKVLVRDEGDILYFFDGNGRPSKMNISSFKAGLYTPVTKDIINVHKAPSLSPPTASYSNDITRRSNALRNRLFRFKSVYSYNDFENSTTSPISSLPLPIFPVNEIYTNEITNNNVINVRLNTGGKDVRKIYLLMSFVNKTNDWSDFAIVESIDKAGLGLGDNVEFTYSFYNDGTYAPYDINQSLLLFDYVPDIAVDLELINGNVLGLANVTEGYSRELAANVTVDVLKSAVSSGVGSLTGAVTTISGVYQRQIVFSGTPSRGTVVNITVLRASDSVIVSGAYYVTVYGDTYTTVADKIAALAGFGILYIVVTSPGTIKIKIASGYSFDNLSITAGIPNSYSLPTFAFSSQKRLGLVYYDDRGKTPGVMYDTKVVFPAYSETTGAIQIPYIHAKIYHVPPIWAYSYQWLLTQDVNNFIYWYTIDVNYAETDYIYFDVTNFDLNAVKNPLTSKVLNYQFKEGDRLRLIRRTSDGTVFDDTYDTPVVGLVKDPTIAGTSKTGTFVKIKKITPISAVDFSSKYFVIQLYTPSQQTANAANQVFFEIGQEFPIINPGTTGRVHGGQYVNQDIAGGIPAETDIYNGDVYFRVRVVPISATVQVSFGVMDANFVDYYFSAVSDIAGRPNAIDLDAKTNNFKGWVRFGQAYQQDTNINGINRFYPNNYEVADISKGGIKRINGKDRQLDIYQEFAVGRMPLFSEIRKNAQGGALQVITDRLLNPIGYYSGGYGIGDTPDSLASYNFADYFCDNNSGVICRLSTDGVTPVSIIYKINSFAKEQLPLRGITYKIYGICDPTKAGKYIITLEPTDTQPASTLVFSENEKSFDGFVSYQPEMYGTINTLMIAFKNGAVWTFDNPIFNNFFGTQYESSITPVFNMQPLAKKQPMIVKEISNTVWDCPEITMPVNSYGTTKQQSNLVEADFEKVEGQFSAAVLCDANSIGGINEGDFLKGNYAKIKFRKQSTASLVTLSILSLDWNNSPNNNK